MDSEEDIAYTGPFEEAIIFNKIHTDFVRLLEKIDEKRFCSGGDDGLIVVWDVEQFKDLHSLKAHKRPVVALLATQLPHCSQKHLISSSSDHQIIVWDVDEGRQVKVFKEEERMARCLTNLPHGNFLSGGEHLLIWSVAEGLVHSCPMQTPEDITCMIVIQGRYVLVAIDNNIMVIEIEGRGGRCMFKDTSILKLKPHREVITCLCKFGDSSFLSASLDGSIHQWTSQGWVLQHCYNLVENYLGTMRLYPYSVQAVLVLCEKYIIAAHGDSLHAYNATTKRLLLVKKTAHRSKINHLTSLCDGHFLASCSGDSVVNVWRVHLKTTTPKNYDDHNTIAENLSKSDISISLIQSCSLHSSSVLKCMAVAGDKFISSGADQRVILWMDAFAQSLKRNEKLQKLMPYGIVKNC